MKTTYLSESYFRPNTRHKVTKVHFFLSGGGLGDYINWMPALEWICDKHPHVDGNIFVNQPFFEVAQFLFKNKRFKVYKKSQADKIMKSGEIIVDPATYQKKYISAPGAHLLDLGYIFYCSRTTPMPGYDQLPRIDYNGPLPFEASGLERYAVFTPGATADARTFPPGPFNELVAYTKAKGITPVFLGKREFSPEGAKVGYAARIHDDYDLSQGLDLTEKTTLLQATKIMAGAQFVLGVDNGLLHFAGTTSVPIIFGHTVAAPDHRRLRRPKGLTIDIEISNLDLPCIGCQSNMRYLFGHSFKKCVYEDYKCLDVLFAQNALTWKRAIDYFVSRGAE